MWCGYDFLHLFDSVVGLYHGNLRGPPECHPPQEIRALLRDYENPLVSPLIWPYLGLFSWGGYVFQGNPSPQKWAISNPSKTIGNFKAFLVHLLGSYSRDSGGVFRIMYQEFFEGPNWSHSKKGAEGFWRNVMKCPEFSYIPHRFWKRGYKFYVRRHHATLKRSTLCSFSSTCEGHCGFTKTHREPLQSLGLLGYV